MLNHFNAAIAEYLLETGEVELWGFKNGGSWAIESKLKGVYDLSLEALKARDEDPPGDILQKAAALEQRLDIPIADLLVADRHMGIGWVTGGYYHRGGLSYYPYEKHLHIVDRLVHAVEDFLNQVRPHFVTASVVGSAMTAIVPAVCKSRKLPCFCLNTIAYKNLYYWQEGRHSSVPDLADRYEEEKENVTENDLAEQADLEMAPLTRSLISSFQTGGSRLRLIRDLMRSCFIYMRSDVGKRIRGIRSLGEVPFRGKLQYILHVHKMFRKEMRRKFVSVDFLREHRFIYFPLSFEPEASLSGIEPGFTNQAFAVELLSRSAPADTYIVIKEHPKAIGNRPEGWMNKILGFPRVVAAHPFQDSVDLIRRSVATATITGSAGMEAAMLGKPVISLGPNYRGNFIDHVEYASDLRTVREAMQKLLKSNELERRRNGAALRKAIHRTCFQMDEFFFRPQPHKKENCKAAGDALLAAARRKSA